MLSNEKWLKELNNLVLRQLDSLNIRFMQLKYLLNLPTYRGLYPL